MDLDLLPTVRAYEAAALRHDTAVEALVTAIGEDDAQHAAWMREAERLIAQAREAIRRAITAIADAASEAAEPSASRTPEPARQSSHFPRWRV